MTIEQAIVIEINKAKEWKEHNLPDRGDNIHALYAEWLEDLKIYRDACRQVKAEIYKELERLDEYESEDAGQIIALEWVIDCMNEHLKEVCE